MNRSPSRGALALALLCPAAAAFADDAPGFDDEWHYTIGAAAVNYPKYSGSDETRTRAAPLINVTYGRWFLGGAPGGGAQGGLGAFLHRDENFSYGVALSGGLFEPRKESDDPRLRGLGDVDRTVRAGFFATWTRAWFTLSGNVSADAGGKDQGVQFTLDAQGRWKAGDSLTLSAGPGFTWSDGEYMRTIYGIDAKQSAASGYAPYRPSGGVEEIHFSVGADYRLSPQWNLGARATASRLQGDAKDSVIVRDENQNVFAMYAAYRF